MVRRAALVVSRLALALFLVFAMAVGVLWARSYAPGDLEAAGLACSDAAPAWDMASPLKVMSYNVQYMASKNYVFFYDIDTGDPDRIAAVADANRTIASQPSAEHVHETIDEVAALIVRESPDIVLLQEINGSDDSRTHYIDQAAELYSRLPRGSYPCRSDSPYWKAEFVFHPDILGPVDMRLVTLSKYRIAKSVRHQLPRPLRNFLVTPFHFQRALLETHIATTNGTPFAAINTHFEAWAAGTGIMEKQVARTLELLDTLDAEGVPWVLGGDLNLLPPDGNRQRRRIIAAGTGKYDEEPQIRPLYDRYRAIPALERLLADDAEAWFTHFPNDPAAQGPDRTIDYLFYSDGWALENEYVVRDEALHISDHLPVVGVARLSP